MPRTVILDRFRISRGIPQPFVRYQTDGFLRCWTDAAMRNTYREPIDVLLATGAPFSLLPYSMQSNCRVAVRPNSQWQAAAATWYGGSFRIGEAELWLPIRDRTEVTGVRWDPFHIPVILPDQVWPEEQPFFVLGAQFLERYEVDVMVGAIGGQLLIRGV